MEHWIAWSIAAVSIAAFLILWFWEVRRMMKSRKSTLESAVSQLRSCQRKAAGMPDDSDASAVLKRSEMIYQQAADIYDKALKRPWIWLPAILMGFRVSDIEVMECDEKDKTEKASKQKKVKERPVKDEKVKYFGSVRFFKNLILLVVIIMIVTPSALAIHFGSGRKGIEQQLQEQGEQIQSLQQMYNNARQEIEAMDTLLDNAGQDVFQAESPYAHLYPDFYAPQELKTSVWKKGTMYLTFDDGPSVRTGEVLDILKEKDVKATFFVVGNETELGKTMMRRIVEEGHTLGMHSYSHNYTKIYASVEDYLADMYQVFTQIKEATGVTPTVFRFPGGSINGYNSGIHQELIAEMLRRGFVPFDWNVSAEDATASALPVDTVINNVMAGVKSTQRGIVLMHDSISTTSTVRALSTIIDRMREMGFEFKALTPEVMPVLFGYKD